MNTEILALKYRPKTFEDVSGQQVTIKILQQQIATGTFKNAYLFTGSAGTGKTTCARIFANEINGGVSVPLEIDAASNNSVDNIRELIQHAQTQSINSQYKVIIMDEVHMLSQSAWAAMLKFLEEPPKKTIVIMCTTDYQKIPNTILSRVQRFNFQRLTNKEIGQRLLYILQSEGITEFELDAIRFITRLASGGMRDAITTLDKCLSYSENLTLKNVMETLGQVQYSDMFYLVDSLFNGHTESVIKIIEYVYLSGKDLKLFIKQFRDFALDCMTYKIVDNYSYTNIPETYEIKYTKSDFEKLLSLLVNLSNDIKWESNPKSTILATLLLAYDRTN